MKKKIFTGLLVLMTAVFTFSLWGCGSSSGLEGSWKLSELQAKGESYTIKELADKVGSNKADEVSVILEVDGDGGFSLIRSGQEGEDITGTYSETEEGYLFQAEGRGSVTGTIEDEKLVLHDSESSVESKVIFEKE